MRALLASHPALQTVLPLADLASLPTPVRVVRGLADTPLWIKHDGLSGSPYGGNKVRKLELLLAEACAHNAREVVTFGGAGSNHATATAIYARRLGLRCTLVLAPQPPLPAVGRNLRACCAHGARFHYCDTFTDFAAAGQHICHQRQAAGLPQPWIIPPGGSTACGGIGLVNAAFELVAQVRSGILPAPERIYVALGTAGTAAGLLVGLRAAGLSSRLVCVRVVDRAFGTALRCTSLASAIASLLHRLDPAFPDLRFHPCDIDLRHDWYGSGYGVATPAARQAVSIMRDTAGIPLETTYTGKAFACLLADLPHLGCTRPVLFWNTCNAHDTKALGAAADLSRLPAALRQYCTDE